MDSDMLQVTLGREELSVLLRLFHAPALPGMEENPWQGMPAGLAAAAMVSAERSLRARGILNVQESGKRIEVEPVTMALVGSCLKPRYSLRVASQMAGKILTTCFYHVALHLTVEHASPEIGLYQFTGVAEPREMIPRIMALLQLTPSVAQSPTAEIAESKLLQARRQAQAGDTDSVRSLLRSNGVADITADALALTFANPLVNSSIVRVIYAGSPEQQTQGFSVLQASNALWAMTPIQNGELRINIQAVTVGQVEERLATLFSN